VKLAKMWAPAGYQLVNHLLNTEEDIRLPRPVDGQDFSFNNCAYDKSDNSIVIWGTTGHDAAGNGNWCFCKYLIDEGTYKWVKTPADLDPSSRGALFGRRNRSAIRPTCERQSNLDGGTVGWMRRRCSTPARASTSPTSRPATSSISEPSPLNNYADGAWAMNAWDDDTKSVMGAPTRVFVNKQGEGASLQSIVDDVLCRPERLSRASIGTAVRSPDINVHGYVISRDSTAKDVSASLPVPTSSMASRATTSSRSSCVAAPIATITEKHLRGSRTRTSASRRPALRKWNFRCA
jgi:hypothetical protein